MKPLKVNFNKHVFLSLFVAVLPLGLSAQNNSNAPSVEDLRRQYNHKTEIVCTKSSSTYTFEFDTKNPYCFVTTKQAIQEEFMALANDLHHRIFLHYSELTDLDHVRVYDKKNHLTDAYVADVSNEDESGDFLYTGDRVKFFTLDFNLPGDQAGYKGDKYYSDPRYIAPAYFMDNLPTMEKDIIISVPKWMNLELKEMNFAGYDIQKSVTTDPKTGNAVYTYVGKNMKGIDYREKHVPGMGYMFPHVLILCKTYTDANGTHSLIGSVDDLYAWYHKLVNEAGNNDAALKPLVNDLIKGKTTDIDKIKAIYYWVEDNIRYLAVENGIAGNKPDPCQNVLQKRFGDCKGMANLLVEMLKLCGIDARHVWLGTKELRGYDYSIPSLCVNNHCICAVVLNNKFYFLDGTEKYAPFDDNADRIQGRQVIIENGDKYLIQTVPVAPIDRSKVVVNTTMTLAPNDMLSGTEHDIYNGESKTQLLYIYHEVPSDKKNLALNIMVEGNDPDLMATNVVASDLDNREIPITASYKYTLKNQVSDFDNDVYVTIDPYKWLQDKFFDSTRECDYEFDYRWNNVMNDTLVVPAGYTIKHVPDNLNITTPDYVFKVNISQNGNKVIYHKEIQILNEIIDTKNFDKWNADLAQLKKVYDDQVILTKS
jgi:hypothetical protein